MTAHTGDADCPYCGRHIRTDHNRYVRHSITPKQADRCPMTDQRVPVAGHRDIDYERRAYTVMDLAEQIQNYDPAVVWAYLTALPAAELQRLMMIALAAVPVDRDMAAFAWVENLPAAQYTEEIPA